MSVPQGQNQVTPPLNLPNPALLRFNQAILVSRHDPASRRRVVEEVRRRATSGGKWPQVGKRYLEALPHVPNGCSFLPTSLCALGFLFLFSFFHPGTIFS